MSRSPSNSAFDLPGTKPLTWRDRQRMMTDLFQCRRCNVAAGTECVTIRDRKPTVMHQWRASRYWTFYSQVSAARVRLGLIESADGTASR